MVNIFTWNYADSLISVTCSIPYHVYGSKSSLRIGTFGVLDMPGKYHHQWFVVFKIKTKITKCIVLNCQKIRTWKVTHFKSIWKEHMLEKILKSCEKCSNLVDSRTNVIWGFEHKSRYAHQKRNNFGSDLDTWTFKRKI